MVVEHRFEYGASPYEAGLVSVNCIWNVMAHAQKLDFAFRRNGRVHLNRRGHQFSRLLAGELFTSTCKVCTACASLCPAVMWRLLVTHSILFFPLHFSSRASPCAITFQLGSTSAVSECVDTRRDEERCRTTSLTKCYSGISKKYVFEKWLKQNILTAKSNINLDIQKRHNNVPVWSICSWYIFELRHNVNSKWAIFGLCHCCIQWSTSP